MVRVGNINASRGDQYGEDGRVTVASVSLGGGLSTIYSMVAPLAARTQCRPAGRL